MKSLKAFIFKAGAKQAEPVFEKKNLQIFSFVCQASQHGRQDEHIPS